MTPICKFICFVSFVITIYALNLSFGVLLSFSSVFKNFCDIEDLHSIVTLCMGQGFIITAPLVVLVIIVIICMKIPYPECLRESTPVPINELSNLAHDTIILPLEPIYIKT